MSDTPQTAEEVVPDYGVRPCPYCGAEPGQLCRDGDVVYQFAIHTSRINPAAKTSDAKEAR